MKITIQRFLSIILTVLLFISIIPVSGLSQFVSAASKSSSQPTDNATTSKSILLSDDTHSIQLSNNNSFSAAPPSSAMITANGLIEGTDEGITRVEWLHNLAVVFDMTITEGNLPDNYFADLEEDSPFYNDVLLAVEFGVVDVPAGGNVYPDGLATRMFAAQTLNFCLSYYFEKEVEYTFSDVNAVSSPVDAQIAIDRGWFELIDGQFMPEQSITKAEVQIMLEDAQTVFTNTAIDENHEDSVVFKSNVIVIPKGTEVQFPDENTVIIPGCPDTLSSGDLFAVYDGEYPIAYYADKIDVQDNDTVITITVADLEDAYESYDIEGSMASDEMDIEPTEGVEVETEEQPVSGPAKAPGIKKASGTKTFKTIKAALKYTIGSGDTKTSISGSVKMSKPTLDYRINNEQLYVMFSSPMDLSFSIERKSKESIEHDFDLYTLGIPLVGGLNVSVSVSLAGKASGAVKGTLVTGIEWKNGEHPRMIKGFQHEYSYLTIEATMGIGLKAKLGLFKTPVIKAYVYGEI